MAKIVNAVRRGPAPWSPQWLFGSLLLAVALTGCKSGDEDECRCRQDLPSILAPDIPGDIHCNRQCTGR